MSSLGLCRREVRPPSKALPEDERAEVAAIAAGWARFSAPALHLMTTTDSPVLRVAGRPVARYVTRPELSPGSPLDRLSTRSRLRRARW